MTDAQRHQLLQAVRLEALRLAYDYFAETVTKEQLRQAAETGDGEPILALSIIGYVENFQ